MSIDLDPVRAGRRLYRLHMAAAVLSGLALCCSALGFVQIANAGVFLVLIALVASVETLRVLILSDRRPRR